ncbi:MAG: hypothetical protein PVJ28_03115 [Acidimicrobiia bacterium]|jgi:hypothetical protein
MTHLAVGFGRGFPRTWIFPIAALTILLGIAAAGRLSRSIVADFIAWWPIWLGIGIAAYLLRERKIGRFRVAGLVPLVALLFVGLFAWGHLAGWSIMPSASQRLVGPEVGSFAEASLSADIEGRIQLSGGGQYLYLVEPIKQGGTIGIPGATEQVVDSQVSVELDPPPPADVGLYGYAGWDISLAVAPVWSVDLGGAIDADLTGLAVSGLSLSGSGTVRLVAVDAATPLDVNGSFRVVVPSDVPARVVGVASVPASWELTEEGAASPIAGDGWVITVVGEGSVTVTQS